MTAHKTHFCFNWYDPTQNPPQFKENKDQHNLLTSEQTSDSSWTKGNAQLRPKPPRNTWQRETPNYVTRQTAQAPNKLCMQPIPVQAQYPTSSDRPRKLPGHKKPQKKTTRAWNTIDNRQQTTQTRKQNKQTTLSKYTYTHTTKTIPRGNPPHHDKRSHQISYSCTNLLRSRNTHIQMNEKKIIRVTITIWPTNTLPGHERHQNWERRGKKFRLNKRL